MKIYKTRKEIPSQYKWDLEKMLKGKTPEYYFEQLKKIGDYLTHNKESYVKTKQDFVAYLEEEKEFCINTNIYSNWISNNYNVNLIDKDVSKLMEEYSFWKYNFGKEHANDINFVIKNEKIIKKYLEDDNLKHHREEFDIIFDKKKHILSSIEETLMSKISRGISDMENLFSTLSIAETRYNSVKDSKGKTHILTDGNYYTLIKSDDIVLRKNTFKEYWDRHLEHKETFSAMLYEHKKAESTIASIRNYKSSVDMLTSADYINENLLKNIYKVVSEKYYLEEAFNRTWKQNYKKVHGKKAELWDLSVELVKINNKYTIEEAKKMVIESLKPLGKEYIDMVKTSFKDRWVDFLPVANKRTGAYSISDTYGIDNKYILMTFDGTFRAVETLAHELGHSIHSYYSDKYNPFEESGYEILVAEIASTFNELMLANYHLKNSKSDKEKLFIIEQLIMGIRGAINRQAMWSEYEYELYKAIDEGLPVNNWDAQQDIYQKVRTKYLGGKKAKRSIVTKCSSFYVPHYYYGFYVYKYVIGLAGAYAFYANYKIDGEKAIDNYIKNFLSAGAKGKPLDRLKAAGVDLTSPQVLYNVFNIFEEYIKEYKALSKKVFK